MKKSSFSIAILILLISSCSHKQIPVTSSLVFQEITNTSGQTILAGHAPLSVFQKPPYNSWLCAAYNDYPVDSAAIPLMQKALNKISIDIFLGSWCGDSKREVPRMLKILSKANFDTTRLSLVFVNNNTENYKQSPQHEEQGKNIHHVPTFIFYDHNREIGRIVESPVTNLERDMTQIIQRANYMPNYVAIEYWLKHVSGRNKIKSNDVLKQMVVDIKPLCKHYGEFNTYGYVLLAAKKTKEALNVFRLNTFIYPNTAGVFDSLGEAYAATGNTQAAIEAYQKVLELSPGNQNATKMILKLK